MMNEMKTALPDQPNILAVRKDMLVTTSHQMIVGIGVFFLASLIVSAGNSTWDVMLKLLAVAVLCILLSALSYHLVERSYRLALVIWQSGLFILLTGAIFLLRQPELLLVYIVLPLIAAATLGWRFVLVYGILAGILLIWVPQAAEMPFLSLLDIALALIIGVLAALPGWIATSSLVQVTAWSAMNYEQARQNLEAARDQRLEFKQVQEDLIKANNELARMTDRLKVLHQVAEEARQAKVQFVANVSHELRTPLNMIIGFSEMISQSPHVYGDRLPAALMTDISAIQRNAQHLSKLINDVLDLSQVEAGRMALNKGWTDIRDLIEAAVAMVRSLFEKKGLRLTVDLPIDLPQVFCDGGRIQQVIVNLLSNAGRFTSKGGVTIRCKVVDNEMIVEVIDTGPGISPEDQSRLFEPFHQADSTTHRNYGGSGLGLSISKQFIEMHGGNITLESKVGVGTTFTFTLPLETISSEPSPGKSSPVTRWFNPADPFGYRLRTRPFKAPPPVVRSNFLLVEKEHTLHHLFSRYVTDADIIVLTDFQQVATQLKRSPSQVLVVNTPPNETPLSDLSNLPYGTPAISCWVPGEEETAKQLGVVHYLVKPFSRENLLQAIVDLKLDIRNILVVDDNTDELHLIVRMLTAGANDYQISMATNGRRALTMLRNRRPDLLLLDLVMPGLDGLSVLREKKLDPSICDIPVIVLTGQDPTGGFIGNTLTIVRGSQLSAQELLACIQAVAQVFAPLHVEEET